MKKGFAKNKFKLVALLAIFAAAVALFTSTTIAFFTDVRESTSVFTAGNVYIELTEAQVKADDRGNLIEDPSASRIQGADISNGGSANVHNYGYIFPGQTIHKDPTVKNVGDDNAWVAVKVIIEDGNGDIHKLFGYNDNLDDIDIEEFLRGGLLAESVRVGPWNGISHVCYNNNYAMVQAPDRAHGKYEFYFIMLNPFAKNESVTVFEEFFVMNEFGNREMQEFKELKLTVQAFAVQQFGFSSCYEAMRAAFSSHFASCQ
jgi:predicted ribosomally synthesized peptide with SipW-like signal peptide